MGNSIQKRGDRTPFCFLMNHVTFPPLLWLGWIFFLWCFHIECGKYFEFFFKKISSLEIKIVVFLEKLSLPQLIEFSSLNKRSLTWIFIIEKTLVGSISPRMKPYSRGVYDGVGSKFSNIKSNHLCQILKFINQFKLKNCVFLSFQHRIFLDYVRVFQYQTIKSFVSIF